MSEILFINACARENSRTLSLAKEAIVLSDKASVKQILAD